MTSTEIAPLPPRTRPTGLCVEATDKEAHHAFYSSLQYTATFALLRMAHWYPSAIWIWIWLGAFELGETEPMVTDNGKPLIEPPRERECSGSRHLTAKRTKAY